MIGVVLMSHGQMAEGTYDTLKMFFGQDIEQIKIVTLKPEDDPEELDERIAQACKDVDDGHGVVGFCDLAGGTPSNRCIRQLSDRFYVIAGMNLAMIMEFLGNRIANQDIKEYDFDSLINTAKDGVISLNEQFKDLIKHDE